MPTTKDYYAPIAPLIDTDAYKLDHRRQYPEGTTRVLANYTNRATRVPGMNYAVHFGFQAFLRDYIEEAWEDFFNASEDEVADLYSEFIGNVLGPNNIGTDHIRALHKLGYLPLRFRSLKEGSHVPFKVPTFTVENTRPEFFWLTNYIETVMSSENWMPSTSATTADRFRGLLDDWAIKTTGSNAGVEWQGHDFSFRGMSGRHAAASSGAGHLLSFTGSDNLNVVRFVDRFYYGDNGLVLGSVPATEHSVMCAGGNDEGEEQVTYERLLKLYPSGIVSVVSDTWDLWNVLTVILPNLKSDILARDGKLVIRPDSGDPVEILTGNIDPEFRARLEKNGHDLLPEQKGVIELLWDTFGGTVNEQGYKVLDPHIGAIYGDSINYDRAQTIMERLEAKGFASTNVVFGVGSYTYQYVTRDTLGSAIKATWVEIDGEGRDIYKDPKTDSGLKKSAKGRLAVIEEDGKLVLKDGAEGAALEGTDADLLEVVWEDGRILRHQTYKDIRDLLASQREAKRQNVLA